MGNANIKKTILNVVYMMETNYKNKPLKYIILSCEKITEKLQNDIYMKNKKQCNILEKNISKIVISVL